MIRRIIKSVLPWIITVVALYYAFRGVDWRDLIAHAGNANPLYIAAAFGLTMLSYLLRARRWQFFFPKRVISFVDAAKVLILGFFMNNVLPARAGEFVRAHLGAKVTHEKRTLVLATIASERLADGLTISLMFVVFALNLGDANISHNMLYVAALFAAAAIGVVTLLVFRETLFQFVEKFVVRYDNKASRYTFDRFKVFVHGLSPLTMKNKAPILIFWSLIIWTIELGVYHFIAKGYEADLPLSYCVLFLVAVNFSSLIPAAPGGIGVIEVITTAVLQSIGVPKELALTMVLTQHAMQYIVIGIPGAAILLTWKGKIPTSSEDELEPEPA